MRTLEKIRKVRRSLARKSWARKVLKELQTWCGGRFKKRNRYKPHPPAWGGMTRI